jgi:hypothetical protein
MLMSDRACQLLTSTPNMRFTSSNIDQLMPAAGASLIIFGKTPCMANPSDELTLYALRLYLLDDSKTLRSEAAQVLRLHCYPSNVPHVHTL